MNPTGMPFGTPPPTVDGGEAAKEAVNVPALLLIIMGGIGAMFAVLGVLGVGSDPEQMAQLLKDPNLAQLRGPLEQLNKYGRFSNLIGLALDAVMIWGGWQMRQLKGFGMAMAAAIVAMLPCSGCCCLVGLPIGIWALVTLNKPEVKSAFS